MPLFRHRRTGRIVDVPEAETLRYEANRRYEQLTQPAFVSRETVPDGTIAEVLAWAGADPTRRAAALAAELAGRQRKGIITALS